MHSAAILAGGEATRFGGRDKSALLVDGRTIRERQLEMLARIAGEILIVGDRAADELRHPAARHIADVVAGSGPMGGIHAALSAAGGDALFVLACDMPYVTAEFAAHLLALSDRADLVIPHTERGYHPLCSVYTRACLEPLAGRLAAGLLKVAELVADVRVRVVEADEVRGFGDCDRLLANVNTPAEYAGLAALHGHKR